MVPAGPLARQLIYSGISAKDAARISGGRISAAAVDKILHGERERVRLSTALVLRDVLAHPETLKVPRIGALRRLEALQWMWWPASELAPRIGCAPGDLRRTGAPIYRRVHDRIVAVYDELSGTRGPSYRAHLWARKMGFSPPAAWDEYTIDDPFALPEGIPEDE